MKIRVLTALLAILLLVSLLPGCAGETPAEESPAAESQQASQEPEAPAEAPEEAPEAPQEADPEAPPEEEAEAEPEEPALPNAEDIYPLAQGDVSLSYWQAWPPFLATYCEPQDCATFQALQEATGVNIEVTWVDTETSSEKFNLMVVSGEYPDLIQGATGRYNGGGTQAIADDVLFDLWDAAQENMPFFMNAISGNEDIRRSLLDDDGQMAQVYDLYSEMFYMDQGFFIREDLLDKVGLPVPVTIDELETVLEAFKTELELSDPCVMLHTGQLNFLATMYEAVSMNVDGQIVNNTITDNAKNYYKKLHEWWEKGYIKEDFLSNNFSQTKPPEDLVYNDMGGMFNEDVAAISTYKDNSDNPDFKLVAMPQTLLTEDQELHLCPIPSLIGKYAISVSTDCEDLGLALRFLDYMFTEEGMVLGNYGIEGETWELDANGNRVFTTFITEHPLGWQSAKNAFINPGIPCLVDQSVDKLAYNAEQLEAVDIWISTFAGSEHTMPNFSMTTEERNLTATIQTDIETYEEEMRLKFIMGQADIDAEWDTFVETIMGMGYETLAEINQTALTRYLAK